MINPNELRIGNYVTSTIGKWRNAPHQITGVKLDECYFYEVFEFSVPIDLIKPIPLTEEWLKKLGFTKGIKGFWFKGGVEYNPKKKLLEGFGHCEINHVHQLQNLYFVLTGEELTLKN